MIIDNRWRSQKVSESESEHDRKVREYWARRFSICDIGSIDFKNGDNELPYERTAVLAKAHPNQPRKRSSIDFCRLDFTT